MVLEEARDTEMLTVWVAISDATRENGCMWAAVGSHRDENLLVHCPGKRMVSEIYIPDALIDPTSCRERIARGEVTARFNIRWNAYAGVGLCA